MTEHKDKHPKLELLQKTPTGISGLDEITHGGLPAGRTSLVCGSAGSGKTMMAMEFLVRGAEEFDEPGVFLAFEETEEELVPEVVASEEEKAAEGVRERPSNDRLSAEEDEGERVDGEEGRVATGARGAEGFPGEGRGAGAAEEEAD